MTDSGAALNMTFLANQFESDKGDRSGNAHNYTRLYAFLFEQWRARRFEMLEIGLQRGDPKTYPDANRAITDVPSVRLWLEYFPHAICHGFDLADFSAISMPRFRFHRGNLSLAADLDALRAALPPLRIIIDDGSHASFHQQHAFAYLFEKLEAGGIYVIEDLDWQPEIEAKLPPVEKTRQVFARFLAEGRLVLPPSPYTTGIEAQISDVYVHRAGSGARVAGTVKLLAIRKR